MWCYFSIVIPPASASDKQICKQDECWRELWHWVSDYSHRVSSRLILSHLSLPPDCHHLVLIVLSLCGIESQSPGSDALYPTTDTLQACTSDNLNLNSKFKFCWTKTLKMTQMLETCLNHQSWCLRVSVGAEFFLFSEEFAANCKKIVRARARAGQPGLGWGWRADTSQAPGSDGRAED